MAPKDVASKAPAKKARKSTDGGSKRVIVLLEVYVEYL